MGRRVLKAVAHSATGPGSQCVRWEGSDFDATDGRGGLAVEKLANAVASAVARFGLRRGATAYCVASIGFGGFRSLELPVGTDDESREMTRLELSDDGSQDGFEFASWAAPTPGDLQSVGAWRLDHATGTAFDDAFRAAGLECVGIDAVPTAVARVVAADSFGSPVAAVDCGATTPSLTIVHRGRPCYTRLLRDCGADRILDDVREGLGLSTDEAADFLEQSTTTDSPFGTVECRQLVGEYATKTANRLVDEVQRTLEYVSRRLAAVAPTGIRLLGGASAAYEPALSARYGDRVRVVDGDDGGPHLAAARSLLELEVQP